MSTHVSPQDRFWRWVKKGRGCWVWTGTTDLAGYGRLSVHGASAYTHRLAWSWWVGPIPPGAHVLHRCDNPPCVNPAHLFLGTQAVNNADMTAKGRRARGERHGLSKLTRDDVRHVRRALVEGEPRAVLARSYGVSPKTIQRIERQETWVGV